MNTGNRRVASAGVGAAYTRSGAKGTGLWMVAGRIMAMNFELPSRAFSSRTVPKFTRYRPWPAAAVPSS